MNFFKSIRTIFDIIFNSEEYKNLGNAGERYTYRELKSRYKENQIIRNVYLKKDNDEYTEIDLILIEPKGIFVFESKNYSGWIFGDENQPNWIQTLKNGMKYKFYNPIWQNKTHIKSIKLILNDFPNIKYFSVIVFSERCTLKKVNYSSENTYVIKRNELNNLLKSIKNENTINEKELNDIQKILSQHSRPDKEIKIQHLKELEENFKNCPKCGYKLVERENKKTNERFYGCSNFPKCRYTTKEIKQVQY